MVHAPQRDVPAAQAARDQRYEFRCWPCTEQLEAIERHFADWQEDEAESRTDIYLIRLRQHGFLPKLRGGSRLEVKQRFAAAGRIELWGMAASSWFPLDEPVRNWLVRDVGFAPCAAKLWSETAHAFRCQMSIEPGWQALDVHKQRRLFSKGQLRAEITRVDCAGRQVDTAGFETQDLSGLRAEIDAAPFAGLANRNYGDFLRDLIGR